MSDTAPHFRLAGDTGLVVDFGEVIDRTISGRVLSLDARLGELALPGVIETVPSFRSLLIHLDPDITDIDTVRDTVAPLLSDLDSVQESFRRWVFPACYDPELAPDLLDVARQTGLSVDDVIGRHSAVTYHVYMLGFLPGFPYLGDLPPELVLPRRVDPRLRVPAGSISIATSLTAIYPVESPGGWHLIGRTPVRLFDPHRDQPALLRPGDQIRFDPVSPAHYAEIEAAVSAGTFTPTCQEVIP